MAVSQWSAPSIKFTPEKPCDNQQSTFPRLKCNREKGHAGTHCHTKQAGTKVVEVWWD